MMVIAHRVLLSCISPSLQLMGLWLILWVVAHVAIVARVRGRVMDNTTVFSVAFMMFSYPLINSGKKTNGKSSELHDL